MNEHVKSLSNVASNGVVCSNPKKQGDKEIVTVRYLNCSFKEAYRKFKFKKEICFTTFCKYIQKRYKKPHRLTDICRYCEYGLEMKKEVIKFAKENDYLQNSLVPSENSNSKINTADILQFFKSMKKDDQTNEAIMKIEDIRAVQFHKKIAAIQRESYNKQKSNINLLKDALLIDLDFKQKVVIGSSPRQISSEYYKHIQKSFLGISKYSFTKII